MLFGQSRRHKCYTNAPQRCIIRKMFIEQLITNNVIGDCVNVTWGPVLQFTWRVWGNSRTISQNIRCPYLHYILSKSERCLPLGPCDRKVQPTAADRPRPYSFRAVSLEVYGLYLWPHDIYNLSSWNDSDSWFKLLKSSSYKYVVVFTEKLPYGMYVSRLWQAVLQTAS